MLARDECLKGSPWEQPAITSEDWRIGLKELCLVFSIGEQLGGNRVTVTVAGGRVTDVEMVAANPDLAPWPLSQNRIGESPPNSDGPIANKKFRWDGRDHHVPSNRWKMLNALWGKQSVLDQELGEGLWGEEWDEAKLSTTVNRLNNVLRAVQNGGGGRESGRLKLAAHIGASLRSDKMGASAPILPHFAGRPRSAIRHGVLERGSSAGSDERTEQARRV